MRGRERGEGERGEGGVEREGRVGMHEGEREGVGFEEERGCEGWEGGDGRGWEFELGSFDNYHLETNKKQPF